MATWPIFSLLSHFPLSSSRQAKGRREEEDKEEESRKNLLARHRSPGQILSLDSSSGSGEDEDDRKKKGKLTDGPTFSTFFFVIFTSLTTSPSSTSLSCGHRKGREEGEEERNVGPKEIDFRPHFLLLLCLFSPFPFPKEGKRREKRPRHRS